MNKENHGFICEGCGKDIPPALRTSRNHCPNCFLSLHVDDKEPGDRASTCGGRMIPEQYELANRQFKIFFRCLACDATHANKVASDDDIGQLDMRLAFRKQKYAHLITRSSKTPKRGYQQSKRR